MNVRLEHKEAQQMSKGSKKSSHAKKVVAKNKLKVTILSHFFVNQAQLSSCAASHLC